jgi:Methylase involved in ubiquinone/menaquinone biosynthesis
MKEHTCRFCKTPLTQTFVNLGMAPLSNSYIKSTELSNKESFYPMNVFVCHKCLLVQLEEFESPEKIFSDYVYFSSYSDIWLSHCKKYSKNIIERFNINKGNLVIELASNDGYLLQYFKERNIPVLGIEPSKNAALVAIEKGIPTEIVFFDNKIAKKMVYEGKQADLLIANNVLAHVPNINSFVSGMKVLLKPEGVATLEFPHLLNLMQKNQFDTIYHEHFSYFSFITVEKIFREHKLTIFDVEEFETHGGSLRIYVKHYNDNTKGVSENVEKLIQKEKDFRLDDIEQYKNFERQVGKIKRGIWKLLAQAKDEGKQIVAYGAAAKGNTLLNYCGIKTDIIDYVVDKNPHKQGLYLPGTHIPIYPPEKIKETKPDYVLIIPWNIKEEIVEQMNYIRQWGGKFIVYIPDIEVF